MKRILLVVSGVLIFLVACGQPILTETQEEESNESVNTTFFQDKNIFITIATGGTSGVFYPVGGAIATLIEEKMGIDSSVQSTGASVENVNLILSGRAELALADASAVVQAYEGTGPFEGEAPKEDLRGLAVFFPNYAQMITRADSGINSFADLKGKRVGVGAPNSGTEVIARILLEGHGMSYENITPDFLSFAESVDQMKNGMVDAAYINSGIPNSAIMDINTTHGIKVLPIEEEAREYIHKNYSFFKETVIPAGVYDNEEDIPGLTIGNILIVSKELPEDVVYSITKTIFENLDVIHASHNAAANVELENAVDGIGVPLHPGAEKYYKEVGLLP